MGATAATAATGDPPIQTAQQQQQRDKLDAEWKEGTHVAIHGTNKPEYDGEIGKIVARTSATPADRVLVQFGPNLKKKKMNVSPSNLKRVFNRVVETTKHSTAKPFTLKKLVVKKIAPVQEQDEQLEDKQIIS